MATSAVKVTDSDRLTFTLFLALALHAIVVLGITFKPQPPRPAAQTLDITLSHRADRKAPKDADFLAQSNQQGSGTRKKKSHLTATRVAAIPDNRIQQVQPIQRQTAASQRRRAIRHEITTIGHSSQVAPSQTPKTAQDRPEQPTAHTSLMQRALRIASLEAQLDTEQRDYARRPRVLRVTAASTLKASDAAYVQSWVDKVTRIGNLNYPQQARVRGIHGSLRLVVDIWPNGRVKSVQVLDSSGYRILDDAAIRIVKLASPFAPFPADMPSGSNDQVRMISRTSCFLRMSAR